MSQDDPQVIPKKKPKSTGLILPGQALPDKILILPVYERPFFPAQIQPLVVDKDHWRSTFEQLHENDQHVVGLIYVPDDAQEIPDPTEFSKTGCVVRLHNVVEQESSLQFIAQGLQRFTITKWLRKAPPFASSVAYPEEPHEEKAVSYTHLTLPTIYSV